MYNQISKPSRKDFSSIQAIGKKNNGKSVPFQFVDNRPTSIVQRQLMNTLNYDSKASDVPVQLKGGKRRWTPQQRAQSKTFWKKKEAREKRQSDAMKVKESRERSRADLPQIGSSHIVSGVAGHINPMPNNGGAAVAPKATATMKYGEMMDNVTNFLHPTHPVRSTFNDGGAQLIQQFDNVGTNVTRRVGIDVEPSSHVQKLAPHINLQTQHNGKIQDGPLADPHTPVLSADPFPTGHPLTGMQPEEKRKFMERHLHGSGIPINRS